MKEIEHNCFVCCNYNDMVGYCREMDNHVNNPWKSCNEFHIDHYKIERIVELYNKEVHPL